MTDPADPTDPESTADAPLVTAAFLARYLADREGQGVRPLEAYQALFPGHAARIAAEFERLQVGEPTAGHVEGERIGGYRILSELGRGGQGVVYLAHDEKLHRKVALKVLPGAFGLTVARQRLLREAQAASRLDDPGICTVYDAGESSGVAYIAMRYVEGESLMARIAREQAASVDRGESSRVRALLTMFVQAARSLHQAHERGLVHRDIKPSNLMLDRAGSAVVLDFGLAHVDDDPAGTLAGDGQIGTPAYMSPEQLAAQQGRIDRRTDVFSLAVTMYEAIALQHPFAAPTRERLFQRILTNEPLPLRQLVRGMPRDLDIVLACAFDKERSRRYATAQAFADDLQRVLERRPIAARPARPWTLAMRWAARHPAAAGLLLTSVLGLTTFAVVEAAHNRELDGALRRVRAANVVAEAARVRADALRLCSSADAVRQHDGELATLLAAEAVRRHDDETTRAALLAALANYRVRPALDGVQGASWVDVSPDGKRLAVPIGNEVALFDTSTRTRIGTIACNEAEYAKSFWSPDGSRLVLAVDNEILRLVGTDLDTSRAAVRLHDGATGALIAELAVDRGKVVAVDFAAPASYVLVATGPRDPDGFASTATGEQGAVRAYTSNDGQRVWEQLDCKGGVVEAEFSSQPRGTGCPDVDLLCRDGSYARLRGMDGVPGSSRKVFDPTARPRQLARLLPLGRVLVIGGGELTVWEARTDAPPVRHETSGGSDVVLGGGFVRYDREAPHSITLGYGSERRRLVAPPTAIVHLSFGMREIARGELKFDFATTTIRMGTVQAVFADGTVRSWRGDTGEFVDLLPVGGPVVEADASIDGDVITTIGLDGSVRVFRFTGPSVLPRVQGLDVDSFDALHPRGDLALSFVRGAATLLDLERGTARWTMEREDQRFALAAFAPDGELAAIGDDEGNVVVLRVADGSVVSELPANGQDVRGLAFDASGKMLAVARGELALVDPATGTVLSAVSVAASASTVRFTADGSRLWVTGPAGLQLFAMPGGEPVRGADGAPFAAEGLAVEVAGARALVGRELSVPHHRIGGPGPVMLRSSRDGSQLVLPTLVAAAKCTGGALSPDGRTAVLARDDGALLRVELDGDLRVEVLAGHARPVNRITFSADGSCLASGYAAGSFAGEHDERTVLVRAADGRELLRSPFASGVRWFALDDEGRWLVVKTGDGELQRLPVRPHAVLETLPLRSFTAAERSRFLLDEGGASR